ncbi:MAG: D-alanyl-D-alanine carboxypeptidase [Holosporales bacterium]|jgi:D-alanyl-D-alanine carboxypeptidase|nr:D-alanyl-D-alanine carboxypeptidase [Holosporales bacterium]
MFFARVYFLFILIPFCSTNYGVSKSTLAKSAGKKSISKGQAHHNKQQHVKTAIVITDERKILHNEYADRRVYPASLTKLATLYILFQRLKSGDITLSTKFKVSNNASLQIPSKLGLVPGSTISVLDSIYALAVKSANDVAVVVAEGLAGSVKKFCRLMNQQAARIGMKNTHFKNPSGLFDAEQFTTARDLAILGLALCEDFPEYRHYLSIKTFKFGQSMHPTHCKILHWCKAVDGAKTGYIRQSGFNLFVTARNPVTGRRVVVVVTGWNSQKPRDMYAAKLVTTHTRPGHNTGNLPIARQIRKSLHAQIDMPPLLGAQQQTLSEVSPVSTSILEVIQQDDEIMLTPGIDKWYSKKETDIMVEAEEPVKVCSP